MAFFKPKKEEICRLIIVLVIFLIIFTASDVLKPKPAQRRPRPARMAPGQQRADHDANLVVVDEGSVDEKIEYIVGLWKNIRNTQLFPKLGASPTDPAGGMMDKQIRMYAKLVLTHDKPVNTICETGFFRGSSTLFWLLLSPHHHVVSFDLDFPPAAVELLQSIFPGRLTHVKGDSSTTINQFFSKNPNKKCDVVHVDGNHSGDGPYRDITSLSQWSVPGALIMSDDTLHCRKRGQWCEMCNHQCDCNAHPFCNDCSESWWRAHDDGTIVSKGCEPLGQVDVYPIGFCHGHIAGH